MGKDKKAKASSKSASIQAKKAKQAHKSEKKAKQRSARDAAAGGDDSDDGDDVDLDAVLAAYARQQELFLQVTETVCAAPPAARSSATLVASPASANELFLFGGEYFDGATARFFNELFVYVISRDEWRVVTSPNAPLPRSGHAVCRGSGGGIFLFGGEFSSPKQGTFYHYNDFWRFEPSSREWSRIETKGKSPQARSGHRLVAFKRFILLFGGFQDTSQQTKYLSDLWIYDTQNFVWHNPVLPTATQKPDARSSFTFLPHEAGAVLYGGYSRVKTTVTGKATKGGTAASRNVLRPVVHQDCWFLRITQYDTDATPVVRWERRKKPTNTPMPSRAGATMASHKGRGIFFGGVHDVEESEEGIESEFFNQLYTWNVDHNRFFPSALRRPRVAKKPVERVARRDRGKADEEELLKNLAALGRPGASLDGDLITAEDKDNDDDAPKLPEKPIRMDMPHVRFNALLTVQDDVLYIYGGTYEKGDREYTFDDMYAIDLDKLDGVKEIFHREPANWLGVEEGSSDDEEDDEDDDGSSDDDALSEGEEADAVMHDRPALHTQSKRLAKRAAQQHDADQPTPATDPDAFDDTPETEAEAATVDDGLPHPRPFETRRDFFQRTGPAWQEVLMTSLRWQGVAPESLSVKEIKQRAFARAEQTWWDRREEVLALEAEQEAAGVGEVVALADRGDASGGGGGGGGGGRRR